MITLISGGAGCVEEGEEGEDAVGAEVSEIASGIPVGIGELEAVGKVVGLQSCTGTLVTDQLVVTAAHCVCNDVSLTSCAASASFTLTNVRPVDDPSTPIDDSLIRKNLVFASTYVVHPDFGIPGTRANDMAVLRLSVPVSTKALVSPIPVATTVPALSSTVTLVGYGPDGASCGGSYGSKRKGDVFIQAVAGTPPADTTLTLPTTGIHPCVGDDGGPALAGGKVAGVISTNTTAKAVAAYGEWIGLQASSKGNRVGVWNLAGAAPAGNSDYVDTRADPSGLLGWIDSNDVRLTGDFFGTGSDQVLYINRGGVGGKLRIASYVDGTGPTESLFLQNYTGSPGIFDEFIGSTDSQLVGDFTGVGHDQLLLINRNGGRRFRVVDFNFMGGLNVPYDSTFTSDPLDGMLDSTDGLLVGDFRGLGHDQLMMINRGAGSVRILVVDLSNPSPPADWVYVESYGDSTVLDTLHDAGDLLLAGDFRDLGYDQVMFVNRSGAGKRVLVADFSDGWQPVESRYAENYGQSTVLDGFHDDSADVALAGDFRGIGYDQVAFVNRAGPVTLKRVLVADFADGLVPASAPFVQFDVSVSPLKPRIDANDIVLAGDLLGAGRPSLVTIELLEP